MSAAGEAAAAAADRQPLDWQAALSLLEAAYPEVRRLLLGDLGQLSNQFVPEHVGRVLDHNVPHGKRTRAATVLVAYSAFGADDPEEAAPAAWAVELLQASFLVHDDIMDASWTRRGRPCWFRVDGVGLGAVNDGILLNELLYRLLQLRCPPAALGRLLPLLHDVTLKTSLGQAMDWQLAERLRRREAPTMENYAEMVRHKTAHYSFLLPVGVACCLRGLPAPLLALAADLLLPIGEFFQAQDDFLDCFGDSDVTGKVGTDIEEGKCTWLAMKFLELAGDSDEDLSEFWSNFGRRDAGCAQRVRRLYERRGLPRLFRDYEAAADADIRAAIDRAAVGGGADALALCQVCSTLLSKIFGRSK